MASSAVNSLKLRLSAEIQSERLSRSGPVGALPTSAVGSVAVDKAEAADPSLLLAFAAASEDQAHRRADAAGQEESRTQRTDRDRREVRAHLAGDVRRLAEAVPQRVGRGRELLALRLEVAAHVLGGAAVATSWSHRSSAPPTSASPRESPARGRAAFPS